MEPQTVEWIDPIAFAIGPLAIRWYALAYLAGFIIGWRYCIHLARQVRARPTPEEMDDYLVWAVLGTVLGGRLGYVLFYGFETYAADPIEIVMIWRGGMSFHGGLVGVIVSMILYARRRGFSLFAISDLVATATPIGLFFGRLANFVNAELYGRPTDLPWGVVFPGSEGVPRHPSQLYESFLEGLVLLVVLAVLARRDDVRRRPGTLGGIFLVGYGLARFTVEFVRQPDKLLPELWELGYVWWDITMGQLLSLPMIALGLWLIVHARRRRPMALAR